VGMMMMKRVLIDAFTVLSCCILIVIIDIAGNYGYAGYFLGSI